MKGWPVLGSLVIVTVVCSDEVTARRVDAFLGRDAVAVRVGQGRVIAPIQVSEDLDRGRVNIGYVRPKNDCKRNGLTGDFVDVNMRGRIVRVHLVDG